MFIHCEYCGTEFNSKLGNCPSCGGSVEGNKELKAQAERDDQIAEEIRNAVEEAKRQKEEELNKKYPDNPSTPKWVERFLKMILLWFVGLIVVMSIQMFTLRFIMWY